MILPITSDHCLCEPFCDYVNITTPKDLKDDVMLRIMPFLDLIGCTEIVSGLFSLPEKGGTFKLKVRGMVAIYSCSGGVIKALRACKQFDHYLMCFSDIEHRVSMLHATVDYRIDAPVALEEIYQKATSGNFFLTRKSLQVSQVSRLQGKNLSGAETGTVYLGIRSNADVWCKAYDKRQERLAMGADDCGEMLRIEIAIQSNIGASLRDVSKPHDIFYHFAQRSLVVPPVGFKGWVAHGEGFDLTRKENNFTTWQRLCGIAENSNDISRMLDLAIADYGDDAEKELCKIIRKRVELRKGIGGFTLKV